MTGEKTTKMNALKPGYFFTIQMPQSSSLVKVHTYRLQMDWNWWCSLRSDRLCADCGLSRPEPWPHIGRPLAQRTGNWPVIKNIYTEYLQEFSSNRLVAKYRFWWDLIKINKWCHQYTFMSFERNLIFITHTCSKKIQKTWLWF